MKLPDAVINKLRDGEPPVTHASTVESGGMIIRYICDVKAIGQTMFHYTPETYLDWFRSMMKEMNPGTDGGTKKNKVNVRENRPRARALQSHCQLHRKRGSRPIGFCLIRQSSASPIECFHRSNQIPAHTSSLHWRAKALVGCVLNMERRRGATAAAFLSGDTGGRIIR